MKRIIFIIALLCTLGVVGRAWYVHAQFSIPELKARKAGLQPEEFKREQQRYAMLVSAIDKAPTEVKNYTSLAKLFMNEARVSGDHPYYYPAAMKCLNEGLRRDKHNVEASLLKTSVLLSLHHFAEAKDLAMQLSAEHGTISALYGMLCDADVEMGDVDDAVKAVDMMMQLRPGLDAYARAAYLREIHGDMDGAYSAMKMAAAAGQPGSEEAAWTRTTLGNMYLKYGRLDEAQLSFEQAIADRHNFPSALAGLAMVAHAQKQDAHALALLDTALSLQPEVAFVERKAEIMRDRGMRVQCDSLMKIVANMLDEDEVAGHINHAERALTYCRMHYKPSEALRQATKELALRPNNMTAQFAMASALQSNGKSAEAQDYISKAMHTGTHEPEMVACAAEIQRSLQQAQR